VLPELEAIGLSVHLTPQFASWPEQLVLGMARRLPALRHVMFVAPGRNPRRGTSLLELVGPRYESETIARGGFKRGAMRWQLRRNSANMHIGSQDESEIDLEELCWP
jgi:hypothetical protein